jgi:WD40 repeat protein
MQLMHEKKFAKPVILTKILDSGDLLAVDSSTTVVIMDTASLNVKSGLNAKISHADYKNRVVDFTSNGNYFTTVSSDAKNSILFNVETKKVIAKVSRHQGNVSCVGIDPKNSYMFSCGDDGKTFALDIKSGKLVFTLPVHVDTINDIAFSENATWVATASYDKKVSLFSLDRMTPVYKMIGHSAPVMKLQFLNNHRLFSIDKESNGIVWDTQTGKVLKRLEGLHDTVVQVTIDSDDRFLFLGTQLGYILVYDSQTYEQLSEKYIKLDSSITSLCFDKEKNI